jgi:hypothetical protein
MLRSAIMKRRTPRRDAVIFRMAGIAADIGGIKPKKMQEGALVKS